MGELQAELPPLEERPLVTLALVSYNQERYISHAVESALNQDYMPLEIIISDDCSTDDTYSIAQDLVSKYTGPHVVQVNRMERNVGLARHLNHVFKMARGEIVVLAAGDDICFAKKVSSLSRPMLNNDQIMGVHSDAIVIDNDGKELYQGGLDAPDNLSDLKKIVSFSLGVVSQSHAFRKCVHDYFGPYDSDVTNEGKVMAFREAILGRIAYIKEPLTYYRTGSGVSTYSGTDIDQLTLGEPRKVASWNFTAIKQIEKDCRRLEKIDASLLNLIHSRKSYLKKILDINTKSFAVLPLLQLAGNPSQFLFGLKAFLRRNAPRPLRALYCKRLLVK